MKNQAYYLRATVAGWDLYPLCGLDTSERIIPIATNLDKESVIQSLAEGTPTQHAKATAHIVIGVPASWCLCTRVSDEGLPRTSTAQSSQALDYRVESMLPITAEQCAIDYVGPGPEFLGIALNADRLTSLVHALEDEGHAIESISPQAVLAAQGWLNEREPGAVNEPVSILWAEAGGADKATSYQLLHCDPASPPRWRVINADTERDPGLLQQLELDAILVPEPSRRWHTTAGLQGLLALATDSALKPELLSDPLESESAAAHAIATRSKQPWVNLSRGPLAQRYQWRRLRFPAMASVAAMAVLLVSVLSILWLRAEQHNRIAQDYDDRSAEVFVQALPGQAVPTSPKRRLQARLKQLRGESGLAAGETLDSPVAPTLTLLHDLLASLPSDQRYAITDLRIEDGQLRMTGYARSHGEADELANTLRASSLFIVEPPSTDNLAEGGVRFTLQAKHMQPDEAHNDSPRVPSEPTPEVPSLAERTLQGAAP